MTDARQPASRATEQDAAQRATPLIRQSWRQLARLAPEAPACWLASPGQPLRALSRGELMARVDAWHQWLDNLPAAHAGRRPGARWVLFQPTALGACVQLLALWERGMLAVLPGDDRPQTLARLAESSDGQLPETSPAGWPPEPLDSGAAPGTRPAITPDGARLALELCTSGSTGEPLRIAKRFAQLEAELAVHRALWPLVPDASDADAASEPGADTDTGTDIVSLSQVSHQHIYGLLVSLLRPLSEGVPFVSDACHYPEQLVAAIAQLAGLGYRCQLISSPAQLARLPQASDESRVAGQAQTQVQAQVLRVFSSGAPLPAVAARHAENCLQAPVIEIYGSTETGGIAHRRQHETPHWTPLPQVELRFSPDFAVRSPFLAEPDQWWQQADNAAPVTAKPPSQGDQHAAPRFQLLGRSDRLVKLAGKRVSLSAVERCLSEQAQVLEVRCLPMPTRDHRLGAVVVMEESALPQDHASRRALIVRLRRALMPSFERIALPRYWRFVTRLPLNAQGKFTEDAVARLFADLDDTRLPRWLGETSSGPHQLTLEAEVPDSLIYLEGHFTAQPVVPGVVMLKWARDLGRRLRLAGVGVEESRFQRLERIKFSNLLLPGMRFMLATTLIADSHGLRIDFRLESRAGLHASGRLRYGAETDDKPLSSPLSSLPSSPQTTPTPEAS
ncbi:MULTISPECIES: AMP-binding protein [unclassified Cobetia]|uniref:AMP-binding protein n=1 Tax=unclassified Cobetia TaxID=2609414 RepID=UPI002098600D|nr:MULTISPECIES: AMP-binding protein [unclassified Cobetia]MCO7231348.1 AMP-binding protein [Cobetia sp. Dlab-2-AX]MCO7234243.1 AMP-binding protein [Cobetia sp. Dlab-2-U]